MFSNDRRERVDNGQCSARYCGHGRRVRGGRRRSADGRPIDVSRPVPDRRRRSRCARLRRRELSIGSTDTTSAQVIVRDDNVLDKETLVSILEYERALRTNETVNRTLVENDSTRSVANLVATTSIREDRAAELQTRERELTRTETSLAEALDSLENNPNASVRPAFEAVDANTSVNLTEADYRLFADAVEERRAQNETGESTGNVTKQILADEYATLAEDRNELQSLDPTLETQIEELRSLNDSEVEALVADVLSSEPDRSARALAFMPDYYEPGSTETNATLLVVTHESAGGSFAPGDAPQEIEDAQATMTHLAPDDDSMAVLVYGDGVVSTEITDSMIDSVLLVGPLAIAFVLLVLVVVYRDLLDILLGLRGDRARARMDVRCDGVVRHRVQPAVHRRPRPADRALHRLRTPRRDALPGGS